MGRDIRDAAGGCDVTLCRKPINLASTPLMIAWGCSQRSDLRSIEPSLACPALLPHHRLHVTTVHQMQHHVTWEQTHARMACCRCIMY